MSQQHSSRRGPGIYAGRNGFTAQVPTEKGSRTNKRALFDTMAEAKAWRKAALAAVHNSLPIPEPDEFRVHKKQRAAPLTVSQVADKYFIHFQEEKDEVGHRWISQVGGCIRRYVKPMIGDRSIATFTREDALEVRNQLREVGLSKKTARDTLSRFRAVFDYAVYEGYIQRNPFAGVMARKPLPDRALSPQHEEQRYLTIAETHQLITRIAPEFQVLANLGRYLGLRQGEACGIQLQDINWQTGLLQVRRQGGREFVIRDDGGGWVKSAVNPRLKTAAGKRDLVIPPILLIALRMHAVRVYGVDPIDGEFRPDAPLAVSKDGKLPSQSAYIKALKEAREALGLGEAEINQKISSHVFRKCANTDLRADEVVPHVVRNEWMGHRVQVEDPSDTAVNAGPYTLRGRNQSKMQVIADYFDRKIRAELGDDVELITPKVIGPGYPAYTIEEAGYFLDMHKASVRLLIVNGDVTAEWAPGHHGQDQLFIPAEDVHRYMEARRDIWTTARAADEFGIPVETLRYWAESGQVAASKNRSGYWIFDEESLRRRCEKRRQGDKGLSLTDAGALLAAPTAGVQAMLHSGILEKAGEDWMGRDRVTRDSVMKAREALIEQRRKCRHRMPKRVNP